MASSLYDRLTIGLTCFLLLWYRREKGFVHIFMVLSGWILTSWGVDLIKDMTARPRPFNEYGDIIGIQTAFGYSFPSGHAAWAMMLAVLLSSYCPGYRKVFYTLALLVGLSRIYLGVHYPTDVLAGFLFGAVVAKFLLVWENNFYWKNVTDGEE